MVRDRPAWIDGVAGRLTTVPAWPVGRFDKGESTHMKVWIDQDLCTGDGLCEEIAPAVFTLLDDGLAYVKEGDDIKNDPGGSAGMALVPDDLEDAVVEASEECPGECIFIERDALLPRFAAPPVSVGNRLSLAPVGAAGSINPSMRHRSAAAPHPGGDGPGGRSWLRRRLWKPQSSRPFSWVVSPPAA